RGESDVEPRAPLVAAACAWCVRAARGFPRLVPLGGPGADRATDGQHLSRCKTARGTADFRAGHRAAQIAARAPAADRRADSPRVFLLHGSSQGTRPRGIRERAPIESL